MAQPLDNLDFLQELLDIPDDPVNRTRKPKDVRDYDTWFKLDHIILGTCSQGPNCAGKILHNKGPGRITAIVNNIEMCRIDFLGGLAHNEL